jgi:hypothetical protein
LDWTQDRHFRITGTAAQRGCSWRGRDPARQLLTPECGDLLHSTEIVMGSKVQGEGDYESAREYNRDTKRFVDEQRKQGKPIKGEADKASDKLEPEEKEALSHARSGTQDERDADVFRDKARGTVQKKKSTSE